jgi:hypothetical protein
MRDSPFRQEIRVNRDFLHAALETTACAAFIKESRMNFASATNSTGNPDEPPDIARWATYLSIGSSHSSAMC